MIGGLVIVYLPYIKPFRCLFLIVFGTFGLLLLAWYMMTRKVKTKKKTFATMNAVGHILTSGSKSSSMRQDSIRPCVESRNCIQG